MTQDNFWTDDLVKEFYEMWKAGLSDTEVKNKLLPKAMEQFKASKQKPKDWEILSFEYIGEAGRNILLSKNDDGSFGQYFANETALLLSTSTHRIYSVKRLSDGEVFSIGDKIEGYKNTGIKEINLYPYGLRIITDANGDGCSCEKLAWPLENCKKIKITGLIGVNIKGNVIKDYQNSASIQIGADGKVTAISMDGYIFTPIKNYGTGEE